MAVFWVVGAVLIGVALASVLMPLRQPYRRGADTSSAEANLAVYRRQLADMKADLARELITAEQFARERDELEDRLMAELPQSTNAAAKKHGSSGTDTAIYLLAAALAIAAVVLYYMLGTPQL